MLIARTVVVLLMLILFARKDGPLVGEFDGSPEISAPATQHAQSQRPQEITKVYPDEDAVQVGPTPEVGVDLVLNPAMRKDGGFDVSKVVLTLDGRDVTAQAIGRGTMDYPQSRVTLLYTPEDPLSEGMHEAALTLPSKQGRTTYRWSFTVSRVP
jgi:hypothetical protein